MFDDDVRRCLLEYEQRSGAMLNWVALDTLTLTLTLTP